MGLLTSDEKRKLITILLQVPVTASLEDRVALLTYMPEGLQNQIPQSSDRNTHIITIVNKADAWDQADDGSRPIFTLMEAACDLMKGSEYVNTLLGLEQNIKDRLAAGKAGGSTGPAPAISPPGFRPAGTGPSLVLLGAAAIGIGLVVLALALTLTHVLLPSTTPTATPPLPSVGATSIANLASPSVLIVATSFAVTPRPSITGVADTPSTADTTPPVGSALPTPEVALINTLAGDNGAIWSVAFAPDGSTLAAGSGDGKVRRWSAATGAAQTTLSAGGTGKILTVAFSPDGSMIAAAGEDKQVWLWRVRDGQLLQTLTHPDFVRSLVFEPLDGQVLATGCDDHIVRLWNLAQPQVSPVSLTEHQNEVWSLAFRPAGMLLASGSKEDGVIHLWAINSGHGVHQQMLAGATGTVGGLAFSPDGAVLAAATGDQQVHLWRTADWQPLPALAGYQGSVTSVAFVGGGQFVASGSADNTVRVWRIANGLLLRTLDRLTAQGHTDSVTGLAASPDGHLLASVSLDGQIKLWSIR